MLFRLGINYWPISSAMYWWQRFEPGEVVSDFARIRSAGFDSVRIFLLWEDFQPSPNLISKTAITHLKAVADIAASESLSLVVTFFTGHMSGVNWIPAWGLQAPAETQRFRVVANGAVVNASPRNWYADQTIIDAQILLVSEVAQALHSHSALWAWDLGNENSNCVAPPTREAGVEWLERMTTALRVIDATLPITIGLHMEDLEEDRKLGPGEAARACDFLCMHGYPIYAKWSYGPMDALLLPFLGVITQWLGGRKVLFEEFGAPTIPLDPEEHEAASEAGVTLLSEQDAAKYTGAALSELHAYGLIGGFLWCYGDYAKSLWHLPPLDKSVHERYFGVWRANGSEKPVTDVVRQFSGLPRSPLTDDFNWIDINPDEFYRGPAENLHRLYQKFQKMHGQQG